MVDRAVSEGLVLGSNQCYDFVVPPILGGPISFENIQCKDFVAAINIAGQIHKQIEDLPPGTKIDRITINDGEP
jgi:hypothetical protein